MKDSRYGKPHGLLSRLLQALLVQTFRAVNKVVPWHRLWRWFGIPNLLALRLELQEHNLHDTDGDLTQPKEGCPFSKEPNTIRRRTEDGTYNDLGHPAMGCRFSRFGRNMRLPGPGATTPALLHPNPLLISEKLMRRHTFQPATGLNLLAAAWIQFQVHDWLGHELEELQGDDEDPRNTGKTIEVAFAEATGLRSMIIPKTKPDPTSDSPGANPARPPSPYPVFRNKNPQWWDGSQIYGETLEETLSLRTNPVTGQLAPNGRLYLDSQGLLPILPDTGQTLSGFTDNWWLGLEILHTLFSLEHNAICASLHRTEPHLSDQEIFETARLINCALMAKIHTVEWTPAILQHPAMQPALNINWMGLMGHFLNERTARAIAHWLPKGEFKDILTGTPRSNANHYGAPYALTEEFTAVYRLHPLIPDSVAFVNHENGLGLGHYAISEIAFAKARQPFGHGVRMTDAIYSFAIAHPGQITIGNYPDFLRHLTLPTDPKTGRTQVMDLAAVDIIRDRERGVPRYNEFRRQLRMKPVESWLELSGNRPELAAQLQAVYQNDLEAVDNLVGMLCEPLPAGFGFSDTAFRIFILMASRRLKSDRFFTDHYTEEFYTKTGLRWIEHTGFKEVILRHYPELTHTFIPGQNPFTPWKSLGKP